MKDVLPFFAAFIFGIYGITVFSPDGNAQVESLGIEGTDLSVEVHKTHAHWFLAEYDFRLLLKAGSEELAAVEMSSDSGGMSRIEVLRIDSETIAFRDHATTECLNISLEKFKYCGSNVAGTRIGYFDFDANKRWRFIPRDGGAKH